MKARGVLVVTPRRAGPARSLHEGESLGAHAVDRIIVFEIVEGEPSRKAIPTAIGSDALNRHRSVVQLI